MINFTTAALLNFITLLAADARPNLTGIVIDEMGQPIVDAAVYIYTATSRTGHETQSPATYLDCRKKRTTDADGRFVIPTLDPELVCRVLVVAEGYRPTIVDKVDPRTGDLQITLPVAPPLPDNQLRILPGRIVDPHGEPVVGAEVRPFGCSTPERRWWGEMPNVDPLAVTDARGEFVITTREAVTAIDLRVSAPRFAPRDFGLVPVGVESRDHQLTGGSSVKGRLVKDGQPLAGVTMCMSRVEPGPHDEGGTLTIDTDQNGEFVFRNVVATQVMHFFPKMESVRHYGAVSSRMIQTGVEDSTKELGEIKVAIGHRVGGKLLLSDGAPIPSGTQLFLRRENAQDVVIAKLPPDGTFEFAHVATEVVTIYVHVSSYGLTDANVCYESINNCLKGLVAKDTTNLLIEMERGKEWTQMHNGLPEDEQKRRYAKFHVLKKTMLAGAE